MTEPRRIFFVHLQKTAGTQLIRRIRAQFPETAVYPLDSDGDQIARVISVDHLRSVWAARQSEIRVVTGHFPLCTAELLGGDFETVTMLRHPLERTVSYLRHHRRRTTADADLSLEQVYDDDFRFHGLIHNHMTKMLSLRCDEMDDGALTRVDFTDERLERAKERLADVDFVGLQEDFEGFWGALASRFGWSFDNQVPHVGRPPAEPTPAFRSRILEDNESDVELYEFAARLVAERSRAAA